VDDRRGRSGDTSVDERNKKNRHVSSRRYEPKDSRKERSCFDRGIQREREVGSGSRHGGYFEISHRDDPHKVAGKIAWNVRRTECRKNDAMDADCDDWCDVDMDPILASGTASIATALGVIAKAREYVWSDEEPAELLFSIDFCEGDSKDDDDEYGGRKKYSRKNRINFDGVVDVVIRLKKCEVRKEDGTDNVVVASSRSKVVPIAGAIAGRLRENKEDGVMIQAIGDDAVATMAMALAKARMFLHEDGIDFLVGVRLEEISKTGGDGVKRSLISFSCRCHVIER
jgi:stage V sporulation protein SpoVS